MMNDINKMRQAALDIFRAAIAAVDPVLSVRNSCRLEDNILQISGRRFNLDEYHNVIVIGAGKASAFMAEGVEEICGDRISSGLIVTKYGHGTRLKKIPVIEAGHPIPDKNGVRGAQRIMELVRSAGRDTLIINLISGGGSALTPLPAGGISLEDKQKTTDTLIRCGAAIQEINIIRKHLSKFKGGHLAKSAFPAVMINLVISDVIGNDLSSIASGPAVPDPSTCQDCLDIIGAYDIEPKLPGSVVTYLKHIKTEMFLETPKPGDPVFGNVYHEIIADNRAALEVAASMAASLDYRSRIFTDSLEGDTKKAAFIHTDIAEKIILEDSEKFPKRPACVLSGGETVVKVTGEGKGGRNMEFALACVRKIAGLEKTVILSCGTDGTDGPTDAAGALVDYGSFERAKKLNLEPDDYLKNNDSYHYFEQTGELVRTGPTHTNVMDLKIMLIR